MLRLKGMTFEGKKVEFGLEEIDIVYKDRIFLDGINCCVIDPATIHSAVDPRKAMLDEIRSKLRRTPIIKYRGASGYLTITVDSILDELEYKL